MIKFAVFAFASLLIRAEVRTLTLKEAVDLAIRQNPNLVIARLDRVKSQLAVDIARDPFVPKIYGGSGAAWTSGFPQTINGNPPAIFEARAIMSIYNRPQSFLVAEARENVRGAEIDVQRQQDDIVYRTASLFMDAVQIGRSATAAQKQVQSQEKVLEEVRQRVAEGRELPRLFSTARTVFSLAPGMRKNWRFPWVCSFANRNVAGTWGRSARHRSGSANRSAAGREPQANL